jgi:hypothetical protein
MIISEYPEKFIVKINESTREKKIKGHTYDIEKTNNIFMILDGVCVFDTAVTFENIVVDLLKCYTHEFNFVKIIGQDYHNNSLFIVNLKFIE